MKSVLTAERTIFIELYSVGSILLVLLLVVVALFALCASKCNLYSHFIGTSVF